MEQLDVSLLTAVCADDNQLRDDFEKAYNLYQNFFQTLKEPHVWVFDTDVSLISKLKTAQTVLESNKIYWYDVLNSISAAENLYYRRSHTILNSAYRCLVAKDYLSSAILTQSLLEVAMWNIYHSAIFENTIKDINKNPSKFVLDATGLQDLILKLIWGTNEKNVVDEIKQHKIYKVFSKVAKSITSADQQDVDIEILYDRLCEYVHPNVEGNNLFIDLDINSKQKPETQVLFSVGFQQNSDKKNNPVDLIIETMLWCIFATIFIGQKYGMCRKMIIKKI